MSPERVAVVTDSGCSMRPEHPKVKELGVTILPLSITFTAEDGESLTQLDLDITPSEFYRKMAKSKELPQTSGAIGGRALKAYRELSNTTDSIISINLISKHSGIYSSALIAALQAKEEKPELCIEVIDSRQISLGTWFLVEEAARLAKQGASLEEIKQETLALIPKIETYAVLDCLTNIIKGGRIADQIGHLVGYLGLLPVLQIKDGKLGLARIVRKTKTNIRLRHEMVEIVEQNIGDRDVVKMAVVHTNSPDLAEEVRQGLGLFYPSEKISICDAGSALAVHVGEKTVGIVFQKA